MTAPVIEHQDGSRYLHLRTEHWLPLLLIPVYQKDCVDTAVWLVWSAQAYSSKNETVINRIYKTVKNVFCYYWAPLQAAWPEVARKWSSITENGHIHTVSLTLAHVLPSVISFKGISICLFGWKYFVTCYKEVYSICYRNWRYICLFFNSFNEALTTS